MRRRPVLLLVLPLLALALVAGVTRCTADEEAGEPPVPGEEGAFGEVDDCPALTAATVEAYQQVLSDLGDADRTDTERIDAALEAFGEGPDLAVRAEGLECEGDLDAAVCAATRALRPGGVAGRDLVRSLRAGCAEDD